MTLWGCLEIIDGLRREVVHGIGDEIRLGSGNRLTS